MADFILTSTVKFPEGTVIGAWPTTAWPNNSPNKRLAPPGAAQAQATMTGGEATFTGLDFGTRFLAYALVSGQHRYVEFATPPAFEAAVPRLLLSEQLLAADLIADDFPLPTLIGSVELDVPGPLRATFFTEVSSLSGENTCQFFAQVDGGLGLNGQSLALIGVQTVNVPVFLEWYMDLAPGAHTVEVYALAVNALLNRDAGQPASGVLSIWTTPTLPYSWPP